MFSHFGKLKFLLWKKFPFSQTLSTAITQDPSATPISVDQAMSQSNAVDNPPFNMYFDVDTVPPDNVIRDPEALRLMEEMGFARDLAIVALEVCNDTLINCSQNRK